MRGSFVGEQGPMLMHRSRRVVVNFVRMSDGRRDWYDARPADVDRAVGTAQLEAGEGVPFLEGCDAVTTVVRVGDEFTDGGDIRVVHLKDGEVFVGRPDGDTIREEEVPADVAVPWTDIEVGADPNGAPSVILHGEAARIAAELGVTLIELTLSHDGGMAMAVAASMVGLQDAVLAA